jgi:hypothetical protein
MPAAFPQLPIAYRRRRAPDGAVVEAQSTAGARHWLDPRRPGLAPASEVLPS